MVQPITDGVVPKHEQLRTILARRIAEDLRPGDMLPGERQLSVDHGVSRITVRSRLHLASFNTDMRRLGLTPSTVVLDVTRTVPPQDTVDALGLAPDGEAVRVRRLRLADGTPMSVDDAWYSAALAPDLDACPLTGSISELLRAEQTVAAAEADEEHAALLGLAVGKPILEFDRVSYAGSRPVEHCWSRYRGDRYEISMAVDGG